MSWNSLLSFFFLSFGSVFIFIGSLGVVSMPDVLCRTHALSKALTLGLIAMLMGLWISLGTQVTGLKIFLCVGFLIATIPLSGHLIAYYYWFQTHQKNKCVGAPTYLYKIISLENWALSQEKNTVHLAKEDGKFIHLATEEQLGKIIHKFWADTPSYIILKLKTELLLGNLVLEVNPGGHRQYYHLYHGSIPQKAIVSVQVISP
ncbi:MAG: DUF952 domain-containing protein [Parachlamydiaceae bacterium]